jgi:phosphoserine phosphatase RsbU/P
MPRINLTLHQPNHAPVDLSFDVDTVTMGRAADCTIPIKDRFLSRHHAEIIFTDDAWHIRDSGSANGTYVNSIRIEEVIRLGKGDRILLGDTELVLGGNEVAESTPRFQIDETDSGLSFAIPVQEIVRQESAKAQKGGEGLTIVNRLAMELIEDRPMSELFDFIVDRVMDLMQPSRAALAILSSDRVTFETLKLRRSNEADSQDLTISRTLLKEVVEGRKVLSYNDVSQNENLAQAKSIVAQSIRSALCAPLIAGDTVLGVLYMDYLMTQRTITEADVRLAAQIARVAALKLETTRLREEAVVKARMEEELRTAYTIQSRLLPAAPPVVEGYQFAGFNRPVRTVSGDYYDFTARPDGRIYFVIADVSGKGITAALVMASMATAFSIYAKNDPGPAELMTLINQTLAPKTAPTKFVTTFIGVLDPGVGEIRFANAGHTPPLLVTKNGVEVLGTTDMVVGLFPEATYREQSIDLEPGDALVTFTDGVTEAENDAGEELGHEATLEMATKWHGFDSPAIVAAIERAVTDFAGHTPFGDDVTILAVNRKSS